MTGDITGDVASNRTQLEDRRPVQLLKFWAPWCGSCRLFAPIVDRLVESRSPAIEYVGVDLSEESTQAETFNVSTLPTVVFVADGAEISRIVGAATYQELTAAADLVLAGRRPPLGAASPTDAVTPARTSTSPQPL